jgi:hypothetical protein
MCEGSLIIWPGKASVAEVDTRKASAQQVVSAP